MSDKTIHILLVGNDNAGKSTLAARFANNLMNFDEKQDRWFHRSGDLMTRIFEKPLAEETFDGYVYCIEATDDNYVTRAEELLKKTPLPANQTFIVALTKVDSIENTVPSLADFRRKITALQAKYPEVKVYETAAIDSNKTEVVRTLFHGIIGEVEKLKPKESNTDYRSLPKAAFFTCPTKIGMAVGAGLGLLAVGAGITALVLFAGITMPAHLALGIAVLFAAGLAGILAGATVGGASAKIGEGCYQRRKSFEMV